MEAEPADWISVHVGTFAAIGGIPALLVPENTKIAVIKGVPDETQINRTYAEMAARYGTAICWLPHRVEVAVQIAQRWMLPACRRHRTEGCKDSR